MNPIPYGLHWLDESDINSVVRVLRSAWITQGPLVEEFEQKVASRCGARFGVAFSSGTAALHAACFAAGIGVGDEVITTPLTFVSTANAILYQEATPVFADIDPSSWNIDPKEIRRKISPKTKAILPVHFTGFPCRMEEIHRIAQEKNLIVIEDACHAFGAQWRSASNIWHRVGDCSHSDMAVFSFHPVKQVTTGEGGIVLTNQEQFLKKLKAFRHHGLSKSTDPSHGLWHSEMVLLGYNYRLTDFQCALGLSQLEKLDAFMKRRSQIAAAYHRSLEDMVILPPTGEGSARHGWHLYVVLLPLDRLAVSRREIFEALRSDGVGVQVHYLPVHLHAFYREKFSTGPGDFPHAESYYERALTLPLFPRMTDKQVQEVVQAVRSTLKRFLKPVLTTCR